MILRTCFVLAISTVLLGAGKELQEWLHSPHAGGRPLAENPADPARGGMS